MRAISSGAVQHHFATRAQLLLGAFTHTVTSISERLAATDLDGPVHDTLKLLCEQALPLDEERRREVIMWLAMSAAAASHPDLADAHRRGLTEFTGIVAGIVEAGQRRGEIPGTVDAQKAAAVLVAVVDGLALQGIVQPSSDGLAVVDHTLAVLLR